MSISNYAENAILNALRNVAFQVAATYVKLHTGDPGEDGTANAAGNTTRQAVTFAAASAGSMAATGTPVASWTAVSTTETYTHVSIWDASVAGNCLWTGALAASKAVTAGDNFQLDSLTLTVD